MSLACVVPKLSSKIMSIKSEGIVYWTRAECRERDEMEVNSADWDFYQRTCEWQGFTDRYSDGSFRLPGDC